VVAGTTGEPPSVIVHLVRHGCAGRKGDWPGPDGERPLDEAGLGQALALAEALADRPVSALRSSPTRRCRDTLAPLAAGRDLVVVDDDLLATPSQPEALLEAVVAPAQADAVLCTHGEILSPLLALLRASGTEVRPAGAADEELLAKGGVWSLEVDGAAVVALDHLRPVAPEGCVVHPAAI
jgi:phosphohistidine phosphatase SixA